MAIVQKLKFTKPQLKKFARLFRAARLKVRATQLQVAQAAFDYERSHCKVSRVERAAMPNVDAHCLERMAAVLSVPRTDLIAIDPQFRKRANVVRAATRQGFWDVRAKLLHPV